MRCPLWRGVHLQEVSISVCSLLIPLSLNVGRGRGDGDAGMHVWDTGLGTQGLGRGDMGLWGRGDVGTRGHGDSGTRDRGCREVRNKRNHFLLQMNIKYNFQRIKSRSLSENELPVITLCLCGLLTIGT